MSESSFPFGDAPEATPDTAPDEGGRKPVALVGALVGALVLAGGGFFLLGGGDDVEDELAVPVKRVPAAEQADAAAPPPAAVAVPAATDERVGRNPFKALYVESTGTGGTAETGATTDTTGTTTGAPGTVTGGTGTTTPDGTTTGGTTGPGAPVEIQTLTVELVRVNKETSQADFVVTKSGEKTPVAAVEPGHDFGSYFRYIGWGWANEGATDGVQCARVLIGDALVDICQQDVHTVTTS